MKTFWTILTALAALVIGFLLGSAFDGCNRTPILVTGTADTVIVSRVDSVTVDSIIYRDRWHVRTVGTITYPDIDSYTDSRSASGTLPADTALGIPYVWRATEIDQGDTISVTYHHPERYADIALMRRPDTLRTVTITRDSIVEIRENRRWGLGVHAGVGGQRGTDGIVRAGVQIGVGINFNLWEP